VYKNELPLPNPMMLSPRLQSSLNNELNDGETLLWLDQPIASRMAKAAWPIVLFGVFWSTFCAGWMYFTVSMALKTKSEQFDFFAWLFPAFGTPFCLIGLGMLTSPIWAKRLAGNTVYALTDQRALIISRAMGKTNVRTYMPEKLNDINRSLNDDGSGDLIFEKVITTHRSTSHNSHSLGHGGHRTGGGRSSRTRTSTTTYGFKCIHNAKQVHDLIDGMVHASSAGTPELI
jgi:hypothetical protein